MLILLLRLLLLLLRLLQNSTALHVQQTMTVDVLLGLWLLRRERRAGATGKWGMILCEASADWNAAARRRLHQRGRVHVHLGRVPCPR